MILTSIIEIGANFILQFLKYRQQHSLSCGFSGVLFALFVLVRHYNLIKIVRRAKKSRSYFLYRNILESIAKTEHEMFNEITKIRLKFRNDRKKHKFMKDMKTPLNSPMSSRSPSPVRREFNGYDVPLEEYYALYDIEKLLMASY